VSLDIPAAEHQELTTALTDLISHQLTLLTKIPNLNSEDKSLLHQMNGLIKTDGKKGENTLQDSVHLFIKAPSLYGPLLTNPEVQGSLTRIKDFVVTVAAKAKVHKESGDHINKRNQEII